MDIDQTALEGSAYRLERAAYDLPYDEASWMAWVDRRSAPAVPGSVEFVKQVHSQHGRIVWLTDRLEASRNATKDNLKAVGLWSDEDLLCPTYGISDSKKSRRQELHSHSGKCSSPLINTVVAFIGDQIGDFPEPDEDYFSGASDDRAFGQTNFILPNPMYGKWETQITRIRQPYAP
jgi:acid phosphatase